MNSQRCSARRRVGLAARRAQIATLSYRRGVGDDWRECRQVLVIGPMLRTVTKSTHLSLSQNVSAHWAFDTPSRLLQFTYLDILWRDGDDTSLPPPDNNMFDEEHMLGQCDTSTWWNLSTTTAFPHRLADMLERRGVPVPRRPWGMV